MGTSKRYLLMTALILIIMVISVAMNAAFIVALVIKDCGFAEFVKIPKTSFVALVIKDCGFTEFARIPNTSFVLVAILSFNFAICLVFKLLWPVKTSVDEKIDPQILLENGHGHRGGYKKNPSTDAIDINDHVLGELEDTTKAPGTGLGPVLGSECETAPEQIMIFNKNDEMFDVGETPLSKISQEHLSQTVGKEIPICKDLCVRPTDPVSCHNSFPPSEHECNTRSLILPSGQASISKVHSTNNMLDMIDYLAVEGFANGEIVRNAISDALSQQVAELISTRRKEKNETLKFYKEYASSVKFGQFREPFSAHLQFADFLDVFWGNLFDLHGKLTEKGKIIRLDLLIGLDIEEKIKSCPCCFDGTPEGLCGPFNLEILSIMKTPPLFKINNSMCSEQGNCTLPAVVHLRRCIMNSFLQEDRSLLKSDEVSYFVMENYQVQYEVPIYKKFNMTAKSIGMGNNSTSYCPPCPLEELSAMTLLVKNCPSQQVAQQSSRTNVYFSYNELNGLLLNSLWTCIMNLSTLEEADWLFEHRGGHDEKLVGLAAEMVIFRDICPIGELSPNVVVDSDGKMFNVCTPVLGCGDACIWLPSIITSFGVWCISRIFEVLLLEEHPVLLGEYSRVLNRLQGILAPAFINPAPPVPICPCAKAVDNSRLFDGSQCIRAGAVLEKLIQVDAGAAIFRPEHAGVNDKEKKDLELVLDRYRAWLSVVVFGE